LRKRVVVVQRSWLRSAILQLRLRREQVFRFFARQIIR